MYIIDKNKDFYDYVSYEYGVDKNIVFDRRGSLKPTKRDIINFACSKALCYQRPELREIFGIEIGYTQYIILVDNIQYVRDEFQSYIPINADFSVAKTYKDNKNYYGNEISIVSTYGKHVFGKISPWEGKPYIKHTYRYDDYYGRHSIKKDIKFSDIAFNDDAIVKNPILMTSSLDTLFDPIEIWKELSNYISSKYNDKTISIVNSDTDKIVNHGFDKKTSFRHPVK